MASWEIVLILGSLFFWGLVRGTTVCVSICVPGLLPYLAERPRGPWEGARFGLLLALPRLAIFSAIGVVWGAVSYAVLQRAGFEDAAVGMYIVGYTALGAIVVLLGLGMFLRAAREKEDLRLAKLRDAGVGDDAGEGAGASPPTDGTECPAPGDARTHRASRAISTLLLRFVPETSRGERTFLLLWGSILGLACLLEVSVLEVGLLGGAAANLASGTAGAALLGGVAMLLFALGATIPLVVASSAFAAYVDRVDTRERLISIRVTGSLVMVLIGGLLLLRYTPLLVALLRGDLDL